MKVDYFTQFEPGDWNFETSKVSRNDADLVLYFTTHARCSAGQDFESLRERFPNAVVLGCSGGGAFDADLVSDETVAGVAVSFDSTTVRHVVTDIDDQIDAEQHGMEVGRQLAAPDLAAVFILGDGIHLNGSRFAAGLTAALGAGVPVTGGLAGDEGAFKQTLVAANAAPKPGIVVAVGFYGANFKAAAGFGGGWTPFGPRRRITRSKGNVLYELDGEPALDLYKRYLGDEAEGLPASGLLFPLNIHHPDSPQHELTRTILAVDHEAKTMTFAADVPEGWVGQLCRTTPTRLTEAAASGTRQAINDHGSHHGDDLVVFVNCIGRRLVMGHRTAEEVMAATDELPASTRRVGFFSHGEFAPNGDTGHCEFHNQMMIVTHFREAA